MSVNRRYVFIGEYHLVLVDCPLSGIRIEVVLFGSSKYNYYVYGNAVGTLTAVIMVDICYWECPLKEVPLLF